MQQAFMYMFVLLKRVFIHVRLGILATSLFVFVCDVVECMFIYETWKLLKKDFVFMFFVVVEVMYTCKTSHFHNETLCLCLCCCRVYVQM